MVKMTKQEALNKIREAQLAECCAFGSGVIEPVLHLNSCALLQALERKIESSPLTELECED